jgi:hypothetical protein
MRNPMNPGFENYNEYLKYRTNIRKIKTIQVFDGLDVNDLKTLDSYKKTENERLSTLSENNNIKGLDVIDEMEENELNNLLKFKKRQSTITYSQRMLKKADNLTKFNRKNHSEGNKHITNNDL